METGTLKIFSQHESPRLNYIAGTILGDFLGLTWEIVTDRRKIGRNPVINYSLEEVKDSFRMPPSVLLFETAVANHDVRFDVLEGMPVLFRSEKESDLGFDLFAASFYMLSRYEEYTDTRRDSHKRFCGEHSVAFRYGFIRKPVVDLWVSGFAKALLRKFPFIAFKRNQFKSLTTFDVDQPFEYLGKDIIRSLGGLVRDMSSRQGKASERYKTVKGEIKDPFDVFDFILSELDSSESDAAFFFPVGERSKYDFNPSHSNEDYCRLIKKISARYAAGLHPSYYSNTDAVKIRDEAQRLSVLTTSAIPKSRFHNLRLELPGSINALEKAGISSDYSMGYHDQPGFRAGIARPFRFFNLTENRLSPVTLYPLMVMDVTLYQYMKLSPREGEAVINELISETRSNRGTFVSLWHNTSLLETPEWQGWREVFSKMLNNLKA